MNTSIRHTGLVVNDLEYSIKFWVEIMGFEIIKKINEKGDIVSNLIGLKNTDVITVKMKSKNNTILELLKFNSHKDILKNKLPYNLGFTHIALNVQNIDKIMKKISAFGIKNNNFPQISEDGSVKVVYARGPEGIFIELVEEL